MREDYAAFTAREAEILAVGPDGSNAFQRYWETEQLPFIGLPDPQHRVANVYKQQVRLFKLGRMPMLSVVDKDGILRYSHFGNSMSDIPENRVILDILDELNRVS